MNETVRRILRYTLVILALIPLQLAFLCLSKLCYLIGDALLREVGDKEYLVLNGLGIGLGHFLYYGLLRLWKKMRPEGLFAVLLGAMSLSLYFVYRGTLDEQTAWMYRLFSRIYLYGFLWFVFFAGVALLWGFLRSRTRKD